MKNYTLGKEKRAFTLIELLVVVVVIGIVFLCLMPSVGHPSARVKKRFYCSYNLKQIGVAFKLWADDNNGSYPMQSCKNALGAPLFTNSATAFRIFQVMSNELLNPKIVYCPADNLRSPPTNFFSDFRETNVSYFIGLQAEINLPESFLAGDFNITNGTTPKDAVLELTTNQIVGWTEARHSYCGNVAWPDGSVQQFSMSGLQRALKDTGLATNRLLFP